MIVISFSGIDGAGKSTQIHALAQSLENAGHRPAIVSFWDRVVTFSLLREAMSHAVFKGEKGIGCAGKPVARRDKNVRNGFMSAIRSALYLADALHLLWFVFRLGLTSTDVVIFDRYLYDELANLPLERPWARTYVRLLREIAPAPHIAYILDADPEEARSRKPEYPIEFVHENRAAYLAISRLLPTAAVIPAGPPELVSRNVLLRIVAILPSVRLQSVATARVP